MDTPRQGHPRNQPKPNNVKNEGLPPNNIENRNHPPGSSSKIYHRSSTSLAESPSTSGKPEDMPPQTSIGEPSGNKFIHFGISRYCTARLSSEQSYQSRNYSYSRTKTANPLERYVKDNCHRRPNQNNTAHTRVTSSNTNLSSTLKGKRAMSFKPLGNSGPENNFYPEIRRNPTASSSSDQSYQRRNSSNSNWSRNQRDNQRYTNVGDGCYRRPNPTTHEKRTTSNGANFSSSRKTKMGFKALQNLLEKDPEHLILELSNSKRGIAQFMQNAPEDELVHFVKILKKVADSPFDGTKYNVLQTYLDDIFVDKLIKYIVFLPMQTELHQKRNRYFWYDPDGFWRSIIIIIIIIIIYIFGVRN